RHLRYRFLASVAREHMADRVAVGHTADDQAETILMHFLRGSGVDGLRGMLPMTPLEGPDAVESQPPLLLVRPLLDLVREDTEAHCREAGLRPRRDRTNADPRYFRNRLRHELLPYLATYNPRIRDGLLRLGQIMQSEADLLSDLVRDLTPSILFERSPGIWALNRMALVEQPRAVQTALVREAARRAAPEDRDFDYQAALRALDWAADPRVGKRLSLPGRRELVDEGVLLVFRRIGAPTAYPEYPQMGTTEALSLAIPFALSLASGWRLIGQLIPASSSRANHRNSLRARFDGDGLRSDIVVRTPRPGDRLAFDRTGASGKLADLFINRHIPRGARERWPLVEVGGEIVWAVGLRPASTRAVGATARRVLELVLVPPPEEEA
ncbi:MAG: tRNA lysidine(34) synthetase TilS, partial [Gammaproteobacteria bacterium RBG_16_66_13]